MFCKNSSGMPRCSHSSMKVRAFQRALAEQHAVVAQDADRVAVDAGKAGHQGGAVAGFELAEAAAIHQPGDDLAHIVGLAEAGRQDAVDLFGRVERLFGRLQVQAHPARWAGPAGFQPAGGRVSMIWRHSSRAWSSSSAKWSATPERRVCTSAPPSSSALTSSPVAALTSGGPPRKMVPVPRTMMASSLMAGT
jgi:hypothetical protein